MPNIAYHLNTNNANDHTVYAKIGGKTGGKRKTAISKKRCEPPCINKKPLRKEGLMVLEAGVQ